jgi:hypothetical protein
MRFAWDRYTIHVLDRTCLNSSESANGASHESHWQCIEQPLLTQGVEAHPPKTTQSCRQPDHRAGTVASNVQNTPNDVNSMTLPRHHSLHGDHRLPPHAPLPQPILTHHPTIRASEQTKTLQPLRTIATGTPTATNANPLS